MGSCCIEESAQSSKVLELFSKYGGTILYFDSAIGLVIKNYRTSGSTNHEEIGGAYLAGSIIYADREVARVRYTQTNRSHYCARVLTADCIYMITYGILITENTFNNFVSLRSAMVEFITQNKIVKFISPESVLF
jgi:glucan phosphoethanolaminetransferase (alkaline phosphatase superfamily)